MFLVSVAFDFPSEVMSRSWLSSDPVITERRSDCESAAGNNRVVFIAGGAYTGLLEIVKK